MDRIGMLGIGVVLVPYLAQLLCRCILIDWLIDLSGLIMLVIGIILVVLGLIKTFYRE